MSNVRDAVTSNFRDGAVFARTMTYGQALSLASVTLPEHLEAEAEVPVLTGPQAQGDLLVVPTTRDWPAGKPVPQAGVQVVHGEATGNTHWLHNGFGTTCLWHRAGLGQVVGVVTVPEGGTAMLIHTDEHGANGIGAGTYEIRRKRELADEIRQVAD